MEELNSVPPKTNLSRGREEDLNPRPPDYKSRGPFLEAPDNYRARKAVLFSIPDGSFKTFENYAVEFSAKETKWTSL